MIAAARRAIVGICGLVALVVDAVRAAASSREMERIVVAIERAYVRVDSALMQWAWLRGFLGLGGAR